MAGIEDLHDALAIVTSLQHSRATKGSLEEPLEVAQAVDASRAPEVMLALAHLAVQLASYATELVAAVEQEGVRVSGVPGGTSPENLLKETGRQILEAQMEIEGDN